ncbi:hypothetical protein Pla52nx_003174 [Stieleria varia]
MFLPPLAFQAAGALGPSPFVDTLLQPFRRYGEMLYLNRGYAFFAPDPGPSHLIQARVTDSSGVVSETLSPDRKTQWPRLLYHRHFMLSEFLNEVYQPPGPPAELYEIDRLGAEMWAQSRLRYEHVRQSYVEHLENKHDGKEVAIRRIEHVIPGHVEFANAPISISDPRLYIIMQDQQIADELLEPVGPAELIPAPPVAGNNGAAAPTTDTPTTDTPTTDTPTTDTSTTDTSAEGEPAAATEPAVATQPEGVIESTNATDSTNGDAQ